jgi:hypothetical protein
MPAALEGVDWEAARTALAMGARMEDVAKHTGIPFETLRKRARRSGWTIATKVIRDAQKAQERGSLPQMLTQTPAKALSQTCPIDPDSDPELQETRGEYGVRTIPSREASEEKAGAMILQHLQNNDDRGSVIASDIALDALSRAKRSKTKIKLESIQDVDKAVRVLKVSNGKGEDDSRVTVNLFAGGSSAQPVEAARMYRRKVVDVQSERVVSE